MDSFQDSLRKKLSAYIPRNVSAPDRIPAAVLVPFFEKEGIPHLLFTKRTSQVQYHRGEISFPGGAQDDNERDLQTTALRELQEEVGVPKEQVEVLGRLDSIRSVSSYFLVVPYIGYLEKGTRFHANQTEVEELLEIPFEHFYSPSIFREEIRIVDHEPHPVYYYQWQSHTIWGLTARILNKLLDLLTL